MNKRVFGYSQATALIIAAMVGTGVFTSLGLQVQAIPSVPSVLLLWVLGGVASLCGALAYAELGAALPRSGGEYHLLSSIYHPVLGFIAGVATLVSGLAAPIAVAAVAFSKYMANFLPFPPLAMAVGVIVFATLIHSLHVRFGALLHSGVTYFNIALILVFIVAAFVFGNNQAIPLVPTAQDASWMLTPAYAVAFVYVSYAYLGWNSSIYVLDEVRDPQKTLPRSVLSGVAIVTVLYLLLNVAFLKTASMQDLAGKIDVGHYSAQAMIGAAGAKVMSALIALALLATVSSYVILGPRVWKVMGEDYELFRFATKTNAQGAPVWAFVAQALIAILLVLTSTFDAILIYAGFILNIFNFLAVVGVIVLRVRRPDLPRPYKVWGYPATPIIFALISLWMTVYVFIERPKESAFVLLTFVVGYILGLWNKRRSQPQSMQ